MKRIRLFRANIFDYAFDAAKSRPETQVEGRNSW